LNGLLAGESGYGATLSVGLGTPNAVRLAAPSSAVVRAVGRLPSSEIDGWCESALLLPLELFDGRDEFDPAPLAARECGAGRESTLRSSSTCTDIRGSD
jgi:hypothetical protein